MREPRFCCCIPLAKGICCGFVSLKIALIAIALIDITMGAASIGIGILLLVRGNLDTVYSVSIFVNFTGLCFAIFILFAISNRSLTALKLYFYWKIIELFVIPSLEIWMLVKETDS